MAYIYIFAIGLQCVHPCACRALTDNTEAGRFAACTLPQRCSQKMLHLFSPEGKLRGVGGWERERPLAWSHLLLPALDVATLQLRANGRLARLLRQSSAGGRPDWRSEPGHPRIKPRLEMEQPRPADAPLAEKAHPPSRNAGSVAMAAAENCPFGLFNSRSLQFAGRS